MGNYYKLNITDNTYLIRFAKRNAGRRKFAMDKFKRALGVLLARKIYEGEWAITVLANEIGVVPSAIYHAMAGRSLPSLPLMLKLSKAVGFSIDEILEQALKDSNVDIEFLQR